MTNTPRNQFIRHCLLLFSAVLCVVKPASSQLSLSDAPLHPYSVDPWITGGIVGVGIPAIIIGLSQIKNKSAVTNAELQTLDRNIINPIDRWALNLDPSRQGYYANLSDNVRGGLFLLPAVIMFDRSIRQDWLDVVLMYSETVIVTNVIYLFSPLGPAFQDRLRPVVYYDAFGNSGSRMTAFNRNSFYSGHAATAASASFFAAKVFCDYHPELGWKKYLVYGAATIPPLVVGYLRMKALFHFPSDVVVGLGVGALCGILVPELHRVKIENISLGLYSSGVGTGISLKWHPDFGT